MTTNTNVILKALIDGAITELMLKTNGTQVFLDDTTTVSAKIAEMVTAINERAKTTDMNTAITTEIDALRQEMLGDTPVEAYNTFTELAAYIAEHKEVSDALTAAIGNKADSSTVEALQATINALGALANKDKVSETDLDDALAAKITTVVEGNHTHTNKTVLDGITAEKVAAWDGVTGVRIGSSQPDDLKAGELFIQIG